MSLAIAVGELLRAALADVDRPSCSLTTARQPAIIDFAPYWRPAAFAAAIAVADALIWEAADTSLIAAVRHIDDSPSTRCARHHHHRRHCGNRTPGRSLPARRRPSMSAGGGKLPPLKRQASGHEP